MLTRRRQVVTSALVALTLGLAGAADASGQALAYEVTGCSAMVVIHDMDGDGVHELAVGQASQSRVSLVSGADGRTLRTIRRSHGFGATLANAGDLDGDGVPELLVGSPSASIGGTLRGRVELLSLGNGDRLWVSYGPSDHDALGAALGVLPDLDGDGLPEVAAGAPQASSGKVGDNGSVVILDGATGQRVGRLEPPGLPGTVFLARFGRALSVMGDPSHGDLLQLRMEHGAASTTGVLVAGGAYSGMPFHGGVLVPVPDLLDTHVTTDALGAWSQELLWPADVLGHTVYLQVWLEDLSAPGGITASNGPRVIGT